MSRTYNSTTPTVLSKERDTIPTVKSRDTARFRNLKSEVVTVILDKVTGKSGWVLELAWAKYGLIAVSILALLSLAFPAASSQSPLQACIPVTTSIMSRAFTLTTLTSSSMVSGLSAVTPVATLQLASTSTTEQLICVTPTLVLAINIITFVTVVVVLGIPIPIPEFPLGLLILVIIMILAYSFLKRKLVGSQKRSEST